MSKYNNSKRLLSGIKWGQIHFINCQATDNNFNDHNDRSELTLAPQASSCFGYNRLSYVYGITKANVSY